MKRKLLNCLYVFSLVVFLEPQIFKENSFANVGYFDLIYKIIKLILFVFVFCVYLKKRKISLLVILALLLQLVLGISTIVNGGDIIRFIGPAITVVLMTMLGELIYFDESFVNILKATNIYLRITFVINIISIILIDFVGIFTNVYFWGIDNRFVFTMIPWIFLEGIVSIEERKKLDQEWLLIILLCETLLLYRKSVAAMILIPIFFVAYFMQNKKRNSISDSLAILLIYITSNIVIIFTKLTKFMEPIIRLLGKDPTLSGRTFIWNGVIEKVESNPLLGGGTQSVMMDKYYFYNSSAPYYFPWCKVQHAHNSIMNILYRGGLLAGTIYISVLVFVAITIEKIRNNSMRALSTATFTIILFLSIFDTIDFALLFLVFSIIRCSSSVKLRNKKVVIYSEKATMSSYRYFLVFLFNLFPINKKKIFVSNYYGKGFGDSPKAIIEEINKLNKDYKIYWVVDDTNDSETGEFPDNVHLVKKDSIKYFYHVCTAKVWLDNRRPIIELSKRKNQYYIQLWHGGIALKQIEKDAEKSLNKRYVRAAKKDSKNIDVMISNSAFCTNLYKQSFWYKGTIKEYGLPRNDILMNGEHHDEIIKKVKKHYKIKDDEKILLYAPTFRKGLSMDAYDIDFDALLEALKKKFNCNWRILIRLHPNFDEKEANKLIKNDYMINATKYSDSQELMIASDILISDYSSIMFEFSFMKKPVFLYTKDIDNYNDDRGFYFDLYELPYDVCDTNDELIKKIKSFNNNKYMRELATFFKKVGLKENGTATEKIVADIVGVIENE